MLGRQRPHLPRRRQFRRLPADGEDGTVRPRSAQTHGADFGQQHQSGPAAAAGCLLRAYGIGVSSTARRGAGFRGAQSDRAHRQSRQCRCRFRREADGLADRRHRAGDQCQRCAAALFRRWRLCAGGDEGHAGERDGCRCAEQFRAPASLAPRRCVTARGGIGACGRRCDHPRNHRGRAGTPRHRALPAHRVRSACP